MAGLDNHCYSYAMSERWQNWSGGVACTPDSIARPKTEEELTALVRQANEREQSIRVVGSGHSFVPLCATDEVLILLDDYQGVVDIDRQALTATIKAGTKIHQMGAPLWEAGLSMANMGDIDRQSIAGAVSTGTHGTGPGLGSISTQIREMRLINATGDLLIFNEKNNPEMLKAAQVSLGALGIISSVTLQMMPAFRLYEQTWIEPFDDCVARLDEYIETTRHFEFFWVPEYDACACKALHPTEATEADEVPKSSRPKDVTGRLARYINEDRIDASYRIFPSERDNKFNEIEFAVAAEDGPACLHELRKLMQNRYPEVAWPIEYRTLAADEIFLSPAYQRETVTLSLHQAAELPYEDFFHDVEAIFREVGGRPHWGKIHTHRAEELRERYPRWQDFMKIRQQLDPDGRFLNRYLEDVFC